MGPAMGNNVGTFCTSVNKFLEFNFFMFSHHLVFGRERLAHALLLVGLCTHVGSSSAQGMPELIDMTLQNHPAVQSQLRLVQASKAEEQSAEYQFYPTPSVSLERVSSGANDVSYANENRVAIMRLQQPLWTGGRLSKGLERAQAATDVANAGVQDISQQLALRTIQAWGDWWAAQQKAQALKESVETHETLKSLISRRLEGGLSPASDEILARGRLQQTLAEFSFWKSQEATAKVRIEQLTGRQLTTEQLSKFQISAVSKVTTQEGLTESAWRISPALRKLEAQVAVQEKELAIREARLLPEVYVRAERQLGAYTLNAPPVANRIFLGLSTSLGPGLSSLSDMQAAQARLDSVGADIESTKRTIAEQVSTDLMAALSLQQRAMSLEASLESAQELVQSWDRQFLAGRKTWVELMNAARDLAQSQTTLADVRAQLVVSTWRLNVYSRGLNELLVQPTHRTLP